MGSSLTSPIYSWFFIVCEIRFSFHSEKENIHIIVHDQKCPPLKFKIDLHWRQIVKDKITVNMLEMRYGVFLLYIVLGMAYHFSIIPHSPPINIPILFPVYTIIFRLYKHKFSHSPLQKPYKLVKYKLGTALTHGTSGEQMLCMGRKLVKFK